MFSIRVNAETRQLVEDIAEAAGLPISEIIRRTAVKIRKGKLRQIDRETVAVQQYNGDVINIHVAPKYHNHLSVFLTANMEPERDREQKVFRTCMIAACLNTKEKIKSSESGDRVKKLDSYFKDYITQLEAERRAMFAEVM